MLLWWIWCQQKTKKNMLISSCEVPDIFCLILTKTGVPWQIFAKVLNIKFHRNPSSWNRAYTCVQTERCTGRRTWQRFIQPCEPAKETKIRRQFWKLLNIFFHITSNQSNFVAWIMLPMLADVWLCRFIRTVYWYSNWHTLT
jgi:hypothetical protein